MKFRGWEKKTKLAVKLFILPSDLKNNMGIFTPNIEIFPCFCCWSENQQDAYSPFSLLLSRGRLT